MTQLIGKEKKKGKLAKHQLMHASTSNEWYTPAKYIEAVHDVMGGIDLDPASNELANRVVKAQTYYTLADDGITKPWVGRVFLNPPYGTDKRGVSNAGIWSHRLIQQYRASITTEAILLVNAVPSNKWFTPLWDFPICFTDHRIKFYNQKGKSNQPTNSNSFIYLGPNPNKFDQVFSRFGVVAVRMNRPSSTFQPTQVNNELAKLKITKVEMEAGATQYSFS